MHTQLTFENLSESQKEILIAKLYSYCEGFEESGNDLKAVIKTENFTDDLQELLKELQLNPLIEEIPSQNWNQLWESNFEPVVVDDFVAVRAHFHAPIVGVQHEIVITPKMSFGTGHHATTFLVMKMMQDVDFNGTWVFDFGTGTGILAILAKKLGAKKIIATDIDEWSIENAAENFSRNSIENVDLLQSDSAAQGNDLDVILANINNNILLSTIPQLTASLKKKGILILSGLLIEDETDIISLCTKCGLNAIQKLDRNGWIALKLIKL